MTNRIANTPKIATLTPNIETKPIIYRKLGKDDFSDTYGFEKVKVSTNKDNFITDDLVKSIDLYQSDLSVFNIGTGQGKTTSILKLARDYFDNDFTVLIASPTKSLVSKYYDGLVANGINKDEIVDYRIFESNKEEINISEPVAKNCHVITINSLLRNPGDISFTPNQAKTKYLDGIINKCKDSKKVVIFFDEIHEGVKNFKIELFPNLVKFKDSIHRIFVSSATFSESSIVVLNRLAILTNKKIKIYEAPRIKLPNQALLNIFFVEENYSASWLLPLNYPLKTLIERSIEEGKSLNILSYSKKLCDSLISGYDIKDNGSESKKDTEISNALKASGYKINKIIGGSGGSFDVNAVNIGTTFKSGIDIIDPNNIFIVILPPPNAVKGVVNPKHLGIFINGANETIQAIARVRNGGEIYVFAPYPPKLIEGKYVAELNKLYHGFTSIDGRAKYIEPKEYSKILNEYYQKSKDEKKNEIEFLEIEGKGNDSISTPFPDYVKWCLSDGQKYLSQTYEICGHRTSPFLVWAAMNNQFQNCTLNKFVYESKPKPIDIELKEVNASELYDFLEDYFGVNYHYGISLIDEKIYGFSDLDIFVFILRLCTKDNNLKNKQSAKFNRAVISCVDYLARDKFESYGSKKPTYFSKKININLIKDYSASEYILNNISLSNFILSAKKHFNSKLDREEQELAKAYKELGILRDEFVEIIKQQDVVYKGIKGIKGIASPINDGFVDSIIPVIKKIRDNDRFIADSDDTFSFFQTIGDNQKEKIYAGLIKLFFRDKASRPKYYPKYKGKGILKTPEPYQLPHPRETINLIFPNLPDDYRFNGLKEDKPSRFVARSYVEVD